MKQTILKLASGLLLFCCLFSSCSESGAYLDMSRYDDAFREENNLLFYNEDCDHSLVHMSAAALLDPSEANVYHMTKCKWGDCGYEIKYEPHIITEKLMVTSIPQYKENGYLYHLVSTYCEACGERVNLYVYCLRQHTDCCGNGTKYEGMDCHVNSDWREVLCDTPYVISSD